jgi:hypothetical protein
LKSRRIKIPGKEPMLFAVVLVLSLYSVWTTRFLGTIDGPAHLNNAGLIVELLLGEKSLINTFFEMNSIPVPNWTGHFIIAFFKIFLPGFFAEKIFQLIYFVFLAYIFRKLVLITKPDNVFLSYLIFPFSHNFPFYSGFYNFSIGVVCLFAVLLLWLKVKERYNLKNIAALLVLFTVTYFSHLIVFSILCLLIFIISSIPILSFKRKNAPLKFTVLKVLRSYGILLFSALPGLIFTFSYFQKSVPASSGHLSMHELFYNISIVRPLMIYNYLDIQYSSIIFYLLISLTLTSLSKFIYDYLKKKHSAPDPERTRYLFIWMIATLILFTMYLVLPDTHGIASVLSVRLCLIFYLFFVLLICLGNYHVVVKVISFFIIIYVNFSLVKLHSGAFVEFDKDAREISEVGKSIPPFSVVFPVDNTNHWVKGHFANYISSESKLIVLGNYEAPTGVFPVNWNYSKLPNLTLGNANSGFRMDNGGQTERSVDYILIYGNGNPEKNITNPEIRKSLIENYHSVYKSDFLNLLVLNRK